MLPVRQILDLATKLVADLRCHNAVVPIGRVRLDHMSHPSRISPQLARSPFANELDVWHEERFFHVGNGTAIQIRVDEWDEAGESVPAVRTAFVPAAVARATENLLERKLLDCGLGRATVRWLVKSPVPGAEPEFLMKNRVAVHGTLHILNHQLHGNVEVHVEMLHRMAQNDHENNKSRSFEIGQLYLHRPEFNSPSRVFIDWKFHPHVGP